MKRVFAAAAFAAALVCTPALGAPADDLGVLMKDYDETLLRLYPTIALYRGDTRYLDRYEDNLMPEFVAEARGLVDSFQQRLAGIGRSELGYQDQLSYDIFSWQLNDQKEGIALAETFNMIPLDQFNGAHGYFAREMSWRGQFPFKTVSDYEKAMMRMKGFAHWLDTAIVQMRKGTEKGVVQPRFIVDHLIAQVNEMEEKTRDENVFLSPVKNMPGSIKGSTRARLVRAYRSTVENALAPAYRQLAQFLKTEYLPKARDSVGISAIPGGKDAYLYLVKSYTTTGMTPEQIHELGLKEVARIQKEMEKVKRETGFKGTLDEFRAYLRSDPKFKFKDADAMKAEFERIKKQSEENVTRLFGNVPKTPYELRAFEAYIAPTKAAAEYSPPSADGSRPGIFFFNTYDLPSRPAYTTEVLSVHEAVPGHHFQISLAIENKSLPEFRRFGGATAFTEGWGLYTESLGKDLGFYTDPYQKFGMLSFDMWRACRLVVDTGMHWMGWSRQKAIDFMLANTSLTRTDVIAEVERYIAMPGQALAYKIGQQKLFELRGRAQKELGRKFDVRRFHDALLQDGAMPLSILETKMERWIAAEKAGAGGSAAGKPLH
ncbi:MAG: DUF885 domain-containing protein [Alphaproteobacteria bacterium]